MGEALPGVNISKYRTFRGTRSGGTFEGRTQVGLGVRARLPLRVTQLDDRIVVDVAHSRTSRPTPGPTRTPALVPVVSPVPPGRCTSTARSCAQSATPPASTRWPGAPDERALRKPGRGAAHLPGSRGRLHDRRGVSGETGAPDPKAFFSIRGRRHDLACSRCSPGEKRWTAPASPRRRCAYRARSAATCAARFPALAGARPSGASRCVSSRCRW
ncbi:AMIN-like domain-containing (lipo)protein [Streptomyces flaveolus]|uniref:AMIN-like domain-containing (lipo)protein n=1 Tax=Streptomyces flaveolus TaxID=67297 RepID=UPI003F53EAA4